MACDVRTLANNSMQTKYSADNMLITVMHYSLCLWQQSTNIFKFYFVESEYYKQSMTLPWQSNKHSFFYYRIPLHFIRIKVIVTKSKWWFTETVLKEKKNERSGHRM